MSIRSHLRSIAIDLDDRWDDLRLGLLESLGWLGDLQILPYRGIGRPERLVVRGRVLVDRGRTDYESDDAFWDDLVNMYRRLHTTEIPKARVKVSAGGVEKETVTDHEGYFQVELEASPDAPFSSPRQEVDFELLDPAEDARPVTAKGEAVIQSPDASFLVISDVDDTIVETEAHNLLTMARSTFLGNASTRTPFAGVASLYQALVNGASGHDENPLVFVSRSPWNLYDLFDQFCDLKGIPPGRTLCFRDWGFSLEGLALAKAKGHKFHLISEILELIPDLPVILVGDSGQKDPEIYHAIAESFPGRLHAAFIRDVTDNPLRAASIEKLAKEVKASGALFHLAKDSLDVARRAAEQGWIREDAVAKIAKEVEEDGRDPDALDDLVES